MNAKILKEVREELEKHIDKEYAKRSLKFHKEPVNFLGVRTPIVRNIAKKYYKRINDLSKENIFALSEELFKSGPSEEKTIAISWASQLMNQMKESDFKTLEDWFDNYITDWGKCDDFCLNLLSHFIVKFPNCKDKVKTWSKSSNMWKRRASAVAFIQGKSWLIHPKFLKDVFEVATVLMQDEEDLVQKGYGWMLKVTADTFQKEVFDFVMKNKSSMPRTALRYAIEKMPPEKRKKALV